MYVRIAGVEGLRLGREMDSPGGTPRNARQRLVPVWLNIPGDVTSGSWSALVSILALAEDFFVLCYLAALAGCGREALKAMGLSNRASAQESIERNLRRAFPRQRVLGYVFSDHGAFEKKLEFHDPDTGKVWTEGSTSSSTVLYGFVRSRSDIPRRACADAARALFEELGIKEASLVKLIVGPSIEGENEQLLFDLASP